MFLSFFPQIFFTALALGFAGFLWEAVDFGFIFGDEQIESGDKIHSGDISRAFTILGGVESVSCSACDLGDAGFGFDEVSCFAFVSAVCVEEEGFGGCAACEACDEEESGGAKRCDLVIWHSLSMTDSGFVV